MNNLSGYGFNAEEVEIKNDFDPIPAGWYPAIINQSEMKPTKDGYGEYLSLAFQIIEGEYANRLIFARLNLKNQNDKAVTIARQDLAAICRATGIMQPQSSQEFHDIPMMIKVKVRPAKDSYEASNDICGYKSYGDDAPVAAPTKSTAQKTPTPPPAPTKKPWQK